MIFQEVLLIKICTVNVLEKMGVEKYLRKNYYHRIKCSAANSLVAFMWSLGCPNLQKACEGVRWDKHSSSGLNDRQMEGQDHLKGGI